MKFNALEELLPYYQRELSYLREMGTAFARKHHNVAGRLDLSGGESPDPHVERLLESFAFLTARIQYNIENAFPEIAGGLLDVVYPQFLRPVPSMAMAHFDVDPEQGKLLSGFSLDKHTPLFAQAHSGERCRFRTCYDSVLWPFQVTEAKFESTDQFELLEAAGSVATVLRLRITSEAGPFSDFEARNLRVHLAGDRSVASALYELIFAHRFQVALLPEDTDYPIFLPPDAIKEVGFGRDDVMLPYPKNVHTGYRLLQEYFTFPEKFLFFDLDDFNRVRTGSYVDVLILLEEGPRKPLAIGPDHFMLNCVPIINLFPKTTEPIRIDHRQTSYRLVPDGRRERTTEIHSIQKISSSSAAEDETRLIQPFFSYDHSSNGEEPTIFWHARRQPPRLPDLLGTDIEVTFTDLDFNPRAPAMQLAYGHALCTNRHLAEELRMGTRLDIEVAVPVREIYCLDKPTIPLDPLLGGGTLWRLISHLSLNYLSLTQGKESLTAFREILRLYGFVSRRDVTAQINGLREIQTRRVMRRVGKDAWGGFCEGTEVTVLIEERNFNGGEGFLLASVLNAFLALYASINSFTQLVAKSTQREGVWKQWEPLAGEQTVL